MRIGSLKAKQSQWDGETLTATFVLPLSAKAGANDVVVVFPGPPGADFKVTFTGNAAFTVK